MYANHDHESQNDQAQHEIGWMARARDGDRVAYAQLVQAYQDSLYNLILRITGDPDEARDLTQEVFVQALDRIDQFHSERAPYLWFFKSALNLSINQSRKLLRRRQFALDSEPADQAAGLKRKYRSAVPPRGQQEESISTPQQALWALGRLDAEYRAMLVMRDIEALDYQQMADMLNLPVETLISRLFRARLALHDELKTPSNPS